MLATGGAASFPEIGAFYSGSIETAESSPLRKLYGDDNSGYDRAVGLDHRGGDKNYTVFTGNGVQSYFVLKANEPYVTADQFGNVTGHSRRFRDVRALATSPPKAGPKGCGPDAVNAATRGGRSVYRCVWRSSSEAATEA